MHKLLMLMMMASLGGVSFAQGQKAAEQYVPLGESAEVSGLYTTVGSIRAVDDRGEAIELEGPTGTEVALITGRTQIWADLTKLSLMNTEGAVDDLVPGRRVEVKYRDPDRRQVAEWIKVEISRAADWRG